MLSAVGQLQCYPQPARKLRALHCNAYAIGAAGNIAGAHAAGLLLVLQALVAGAIVLYYNNQLFGLPVQAYRYVPGTGVFDGVCKQFLNDAEKVQLLLLVERTYRAGFGKAEVRAFISIQLMTQLAAERMRDQPGPAFAATSSRCYGEWLP